MRKLQLYVLTGLQKIFLLLSDMFDKKRDSLLFYPPKILIAFGEAVSRNVKIHQWLLDNGYPELAALASSLQADVNAFNWLIKNGYPQFAAFSNAIDDDEKATHWLKNNNFTFLCLFRDVCFDEPKAVAWFKSQQLQIFIVIAAKIRELKKQQHFDYEDYHKIHFNR